MISEPAQAPALVDGPRWSRADGVALALLLAWVAACFAPSLGFGFVNWDDREFVLENPLVVNPSRVPFSHHFTTPEVSYPIPVTMASYRIEHALAGFEHPWVQHLVNVLVHLASVALLFAIARRLGIGTLGAALAATLLGVHPVVSEPVAWLTGRKDLLALCFGLATVLLCLGDGRPSPGSRRLARAATFGLALFSKPVAVALTPIVLLIGMAGTQDGAPWGRRLGRSLARNAPEIVVTLAYLPLTWLGYRAFGASRVGESVSTSLRSAWYGLGVHLALVLGLEPPCVQHLTSATPPPFSARFDLLPVLVAIVVGICLWLLRGRARRVAAVALACSCFAYLPSSGVVPIKRFLADSYVYPALPGIAVVLALLLEALAARSRGRMLRLAVPALAVGLGLLAIPAAGRFRNTAALWADAMERYPQSWRMCRNWAVGVQEIAGPSRSLAATDRCIARFGPDNFEKNRAVALFELGRAAEAGAWMRRALARTPEDRNVPPALLRLAEGGGP